jgi:Lar family restriction alleviation protein
LHGAFKDLFRRENLMTDDTAEREGLVKRLLPCPFCGAAAKLDNLTDLDDFSVSCTKCEVQQIANYRDHVAVERWNRREAATALESLAPPQTVTEEMVTRAIDALVYTGYNDETQKRIIQHQATCREYVRAALQSALAAAPRPQDKP